jgi:hypothetical protein
MKRTFLIMIAVAGILAAQQDLQDLGVAGIQALFKGTPEDLQRLAKMVDADLAVDPNYPLARLLHGVLTFNRAGDSSKKGDMAAAGKFFQQGVSEMEEAIRLDPDNVGLRAPRGAIFIAASRQMPPQMGKPLLDTGIADFEHILHMQEQDGSFAGRSNHQRGEVLTGLADGWARSGDDTKARAYFARIAKELPGTIYQTRAQAWLDGKPESKSPEFFACAGCHVSK